MPRHPASAILGLMSETVQELLRRALKLPPSGRAELARELIASIEAGLDDGGAEDPAEVERAWREEIARRLEDVERGRVKLVSSKKVHGDVRRALARRHAKHRK